jgi:HAD superfamily hydrolase (TIGR01549 family)
MRALSVEAVTFDVGNTLLADSKGEERRQESRALKHWLKDHGLVDKDDRRRALSVAARSWSVGDLEEVRVARKVADIIVASVPVRVTESERMRLEALVADIYSDGPYYAADGVHRVLRRLKGRGIGLGVVSNRGARPGRLMTVQLEASGLLEYFDRRAVIWSDEVGASKPDPRIYLACLRALDVPPQHAAHVGDVKAKDVAGARDLGIRTIRYTGIRDDPNEGPEADIVISSFQQLEEALSLPTPAQTQRRLRLLSGLPLVLGPASYEALENGGELIEDVARLVAAAASLTW